jgi:CheY-like chemotaxis protein
MSPQGVRKTVLVVEAESAALAVLLPTLQGGGFDTVTAGGALQALEVVRGGLAPDLILLQVPQVGLEGWKFPDLLRRAAGGEPPPVVVVTRATAVGPAWIRAHGYAGLVRKPVDPGALLQEVRRHLGEG